MEIVDIGLDDIEEPMKIRFDDDAGGGSGFGSGIEFLMNDRGKASGGSSTAALGKFDDLENELNELTSGDNGISSKSSGSSSGGGGGIFGNMFSNVFSSSKATTGGVGQADENRGGGLGYGNTDSGVGQASMESMGKQSSTWDGFSKSNEISGTAATPANHMTDREKRRKKRAMIKKLDDWYDKKLIKQQHRFDMDSNFEEVEDEYETALDDKRRRDGIKLSGWWLTTFANSIEYMNASFNPFDVSLDGWGEQISEDLDSYEELFGELQDKYKGGKLSPELSLLMRLGFSASVVAITNKTLSSAAPGFQDVVRSAPGLMKTFTNATVDLMKQSSPGFEFAQNVIQSQPSNRVPQTPPPAPVDTRTPSRMQQQFAAPPPITNRPDLAAGRGGPMSFREEGVDVNSGYSSLSGAGNRGMNNTGAGNVQLPPRPDAAFSRPEMQGPQNRDVQMMLSNLKPIAGQQPQQQKQQPDWSSSAGGEVIMEDVNDNSMISISSLKDLQGSTMPTQARRRQKESRNRNSIELDI